MEPNWCYVMCDSIVLPIIALATAVVTAYQEYRRYHENKKK
jgi:hypothetical protein